MTLCSEWATPRSVNAMTPCRLIELYLAKTVVAGVLHGEQAMPIIETAYGPGCMKEQVIFESKKRGAQHKDDNVWPGCIKADRLHCTYKG